MPDERDDDQESFEKPPAFFPYDTGEEPLIASEDLGEPVEVTIEGVFFAESNGLVQRFVLLSDGDRKVPIIIGGFEATSISMPLEGNQPDRPMTHDLLKVLMERLDGNLQRVVIDDIWNKTYYAKLYIEKDGEEIEIDSRPSDAIALALRWNCPIFVSDGIMERGGE